ncbi:MAG TPA: type IV secretion system DNA-binding domain-containing protein [Magnetospirillum sp.]|nr:type IV secretion system DNA-binding domain-containing protein [Magnetospirillum sp.]
MARQTGKMDSLESFKRRFQASYQKPEEPTPTDPGLFSDPPAFASAKEEMAWRAYRLAKAKALYHEQLSTYAQETRLQKLVISRFSPDVPGYVRYCQSALPRNEAAFFLKAHRLPIREDDRRRHTYISGGSGSGKTEAIKVIIHHYLTRDTSAAVVVLDPHGDFAEQVARFRENAENGRLVYIDPALSPQHTPVFNPFEIKDRSPMAVDVATQELVSVFREIMDTGFTLQMETVLKPCIATLLLRDGSTILDLMRFMDDDENADLLHFAQRMLPNPAQRHFLAVDFGKDAYGPTKQSLRTKIQSLLNSQVFLHFLAGPSTFDLEEAINRRALIVFNLSRGTIGDDTSETIGRFIIAKLQSFAIQRARIDEHKRVPIHLFVDECQLYISDSIEKILTEARKYKLFATLASQILGQNMGAQLKAIVLSNTAVKMTGKNALATLSAIAKETGANLEELQGLETGEFHIKAGNRPSVKAKMPAHLLGKRNGMRADKWAETIKGQLARYYRPLTPENAPSGLEIPSSEPKRRRLPQPIDL